MTSRVNHFSKVWSHSGGGCVLNPWSYLDWQAEEYLMAQDIVHQDDYQVRLETAGQVPLHASLSPDCLQGSFA
jgi:hypothetical protein